MLAYSTDNNFIVDENSYAPGLRLWMDDAKKQMESIRSLGTEQSVIAEEAWGSVQQSIIGEVSTLKKEPPPGCWEHTEIITNGPFTVPTWHQGSPFNDDLPTHVCDGSTEHIRAGCVAIALAEIMRYHEHPTSYSWSYMPYASGNGTTAAFIEDIHDKVLDSPSPSNIGYHCDLGTTIVLWDIGLFLKQKFSYTSADFGPINHSTIKNNIVYDRPVYLEANDPINSGHAWVVNGYREYIYYSDDCNSWSSMHYHCVWGWLDTGENGFYKFGHFNPEKADGSGNYAFNTDIKMVANIIP